MIWSKQMPKRHCSRWRGDDQYLSRNCQYETRETFGNLSGANKLEEQMAGRQDISLEVAMILSLTT